MGDESKTMANQSAESTRLNTSNPFLHTFPTDSPSLKTSTPGNYSSSVLDKIAANDIISRVNYAYCLLGAVGFVFGCFLLFSFFRARSHLVLLDRLLCSFSGLQLLLKLLSLHVVAHRPDYLRSTALGCAALSFVINTLTLCTMLLLVFMAHILTRPISVLLRKLLVYLILVPSILGALMLAGLRGPRDGLQDVSDCFMDPVHAGVTYAAARLCLTVVIPWMLQLGLLTISLIQRWKSKRSFLSSLEHGPVFLIISGLMFCCHLFYSVLLVSGAQLIKDGELTQHQRVFLSVSESVLFSGSSVSLILVLLVHRPRRESLSTVLGWLRDCCQHMRRAEPNRNIIVPRAEITDTLQDIESEDRS